MKLEATEPREARGDQFETASPPVDVQEMEVERKEEEEDDDTVTFDHSTIDIYTGETATEESIDTFTPTIDTDLVDEVSDSSVYVHTVPEFDSITTQEPSDQTATGATTTMTPYTPHVSSLSPTTPSGPVPPGVLQPVTGAVFVYNGYEGSTSHSTDDPSHEGSAGDVLPTPTTDSLVSVMTDEAEIGGTELPTFIPQTQSQETTTQTDEGSASGEEEEHSGQDVYSPETPVLTSTLPPTHSALHTQKPGAAAGTDVTEVPVGLPAVDTFTETGSGSEPPSREREVSGEHLVDLSGGVAVTGLPTVAAVGWQTTLATNAQDVTSESSTVKPSSQPSSAATGDEKPHTVATTKPALTTSDVHATHPAKPYRDQRPDSTKSSSQYVSQPILSSTSPLYTFDQSTYSVPKWALTPDPAATSLPDDGFSDYDQATFISAVESRPQVPAEPVATEQPETSSGSAYTMAASTVDIRGIWTQYVTAPLMICYWWDLTGFHYFF